MSTVSMQLNGKDSSTVSKSIDSCHSKEYTENISLTSLTLSRPGASHMAQEKIPVLWCACAEVVNLWVWLSFRFVSFLNLLAAVKETLAKMPPSTLSKHCMCTISILVVNYYGKQICNLLPVCVLTIKYFVSRWGCMTSNWLDLQNDFSYSPNRNRNCCTCKLTTHSQFGNPHIHFHSQLL